MYISKVRVKNITKNPGFHSHILFIYKIGKISYYLVRKAFNNALFKCSIPDVRLTLHSIRHSIATHLLERVASIRYVQEILGHNDIQSTVRYTHMMKGHLWKSFIQYHPGCITDSLDDNTVYTEKVKSLVQRRKHQKEIRKILAENVARQEEMVRTVPQTEEAKKIIKKHS